MLLRVCLILAVVAGLAVTGVTWFMVRPQMQKAVEDRDFNKSKWDEFAGLYRQSQDELRTTQETLTKTQNDLQVAQADLTATRARADQQQARADGLQTRLNQTVAERDDAQRTLAQWDALGIPVDQVRSVIDRARNLQVAVEALETEKQVLLTVNQRLQNRLDAILNPDRPVILDPALRGKVVAVDPKWDFVVLNVGEKDNVQQRGVLMVVRDGQLVSNVKVSDVREYTSIANIMPGYTIGSVLEGDMVVPYHVVE